MVLVCLFALCPRQHRRMATHYPDVLAHRSMARVAPTKPCVATAHARGDRHRRCFCHSPRSWFGKRRSASLASRNPSRCWQARQGVLYSLRPRCHALEEGQEPNNHCEHSRFEGSREPKAMQEMWGLWAHTKKLRQVWVRCPHLGSIGASPNGRRDECTPTAH